MGNFIDVDALRAFAVAASELNMRRAADRLNISQPPLSRKIRNLENRLGVELFIRRSNGLELTGTGRKILEIVRPLLAMHEDVQVKLDAFKKTEACAIGLSTAFEQSIYGPVLDAVKSAHGGSVTIIRAPSPQLANGVAKGELLAAWVALPIERPALSILKIPYFEPLLAAMPEKWEHQEREINPPDLNGSPFFWFPAHRNPYWHERMGKVFKTLDFRPDCIEEPLEYDVLLARIAAGEGWALVPQSFAAIRREGVKFMNVRNVPPLEMGIIYTTQSGETLAQECAGLLKAPL